MRGRQQARSQFYEKWQRWSTRIATTRATRACGRHVAEGLLATVRHGKNLDIRKPTLKTDPFSPKNSRNRPEALQNDAETLGILAFSLPPMAAKRGIAAGAY